MKYTKVENFLREASPEDLRAVYNKVLMEDAMEKLSTVFEDYELTDLQNKYAAYLYAYEGESSYEASYWTNLERVAKKSLKLSDEEITQYFNKKEEA